MLNDRLTYLVADSGHSLPSKPKTGSWFGGDDGQLIYRSRSVDAWNQILYLFCVVDCQDIFGYVRFFSC